MDCNLEPVSKYIFQYDRIWFLASMMVFRHDDEIRILKIPNHYIKSIKTKKKLHSVILKSNDLLQIILKNKDNTNFIDEHKIDKEFLSQENIEFKFCNDVVYCRNMNSIYNEKNNSYFSILQIEGIYNIVISGMKIYRHILKLDHYLIEEYDLIFVRKNMVFDVSFFMRYNINYNSRYLFESNGVDFVICIDNLITKNLSVKKELEGHILSIAMTLKYILVIIECQLPGDCFYIIHDTNLVELYKIKKQDSVKILNSFYFGFLVIVDGSNEYYLIKSKGKISFIQENKLIKEKISYFSIHKEKLIFYGYEKDIFYEISNDKTFFYTEEHNQKNTLLNMSLFSNLHRIENPVLCDFYQDRFIVISKRYIYFKYNDVIVRKTREFQKEIIFCDSKEFKIYYLENSHIVTIYIYDMLLATISDRKNNTEINALKENKYFKRSLENFIYDLVISNMSSFAQNLIQIYKKDDIEDLISNLYRKGDYKIRKFLNNIFGKEFTMMLKSSKNIFNILNVAEINLENFVDLCNSEGSEIYLKNLIDFYKKNNDKENLKILKNVLMVKGNLKLLTYIGIINESNIKKHKILNFLVNNLN